MSYLSPSGSKAITVESSSNSCRSYYNRNSSCWLSSSNESSQSRHNRYSGRSRKRYQVRSPTYRHDSKYRRRHRHSSQHGSRRSRHQDSSRYENRSHRHEPRYRTKRHYYQSNVYSRKCYEEPTSRSSYDRYESRRDRANRISHVSTYDHKYRSHRPSRWRRTKHNESRRKNSAVYHSRPRKSRSHHKTADKETNKHFEWFSGMHLSHQYIVRGQLGEGTFGRVLECENIRTGNIVAIKVVRDVSRYTSAAKIEADILDKIKERDPREQSNCLSLIDRFFYDSNKGRSCSPKSAALYKRSGSSISRSSSYVKGVHMCLVSERLGLSLYAFLHENDFRGFFMEDLQAIAKEVLVALCFLKSIKLTHTDLKPENILFVNHASEYVDFSRASFAARFRHSNSSSRSPSPKRRRKKKNMTRRPFSCNLKLIDFGSATFEDDHHSSLINTRQYRAPEVILQLGWSMPSDMWSFGCILMELYTGVLLFQTHKHLEHLAMIETIIDEIPSSMLTGALSTPASKYLRQTRSEIKIDWPRGAESLSSRRRVARCKPLEKLVHPNHIKFAEFVRFILRVDPNKRPTPSEALQHPFFKYKFTE